MRGLQGAFAENWLEATGDVLVGPHYLPEFGHADGAGPMQLVRSVAGTTSSTSSWRTVRSSSASSGRSCGGSGPRVRDLRS